MEIRISNYIKDAEEANCVSTDPDIFFPEFTNGGNRNPQEVNQAIQVCAMCNITEQCLTYALGAAETIGIWGGSLPHERKYMETGRISIQDHLEKMRNYKEAILLKESKKKGK
jgi:WhiB family redox-sensing transcriptional regulator